MKAFNDALPTTRLNNGQLVLAKQTQYGINPVTYVNETQAKRKVEALQKAGVSCRIVYYAPIRFIALEE